MKVEQQDLFQFEDVSETMRSAELTRTEDLNKWFRQLFTRVPLGRRTMARSKSNSRRLHPARNGAS
jgi:hypothetical protein